MLNTNCQYLRNEIMEVLRAFGKDDGEFTHYFSYSGGKFFNSIEYENEFYDFVDEYDPQDDLDYKRHMKRFAKLAFYKVLSKTTGVDLPWGALTGIRPTKLAYSELAAGRDFAELFRKMCVSDENTQFVRRVLEEQKPYVGGGKSLYISVPFCPTKCEYCSFITAPVSKTAQYIESYVNCLTKQIELSAPFLEGVRSIYVGGGSPFVLEISQLERIYAAINAVFKGKCEYTVEAGRPDTFSPEKLALSKKYGVNRICVNPQSFSDKTLRAIGRKHTAADTLAAYALAKEYGFDINIDLIAGLADETPEDFINSVEQSIVLDPANITIHTLSLKAGAKLKEKVTRLSDGGVAEMIAASRRLLSEAGYSPYYLYRQKYQAGGLENVGWCKKGKACLYNIDVMEEWGDNIALGSGAISKRVFGGENRIERFSSPKDIPTYISKTAEIIKNLSSFFS